MTELVIREVAKDVWIFSKPFSRIGMPFGGRSTAIKLQNGGVWVLASTPLDDATKTKLSELGPVQRVSMYIIGADAVHHLFLTEFKTAYPHAKLIAPQDAIKRHNNKELKFDGAWGLDASDTKYGFEDEIKHCYFSGFINKDVAFLHEASKSMIQADLLLNLPGTEQYSKSSASGKVPIIGSLGPQSWLHPRFTWSMGIDKEAMKTAAKTVDGWDFQRIIPCHGDVIEKDAKQAWKDAYTFFLD
ncbi:uncharacterized protein EV420DRAFT_1338429 [Desarmillaria tabescens]|uniref:Uncharacterized protein n=1 Tax=Armillaria tabescens TaxID=1929756 RepID=A0AA39JVJ5_ARMTA|nr:uncharacterized protein EV420DRAFT_1338429 [Desarmillaria tabescens]KAK0449588.1 hypothetical protein EV420DRAFT_1338429 [Desarmillaria tabescens]